MNNKITTLITGAAGVAGVQATDAIPPEHLQAIIQTIIQILIGIASIWGIVRKNKKQPGI